MVRTFNFITSYKVLISRNQPICDYLRANHSIQCNSFCIPYSLLSSCVLNRFRSSQNSLQNHRIQTLSYDRTRFLTPYRCFYSMISNETDKNEYKEYMYSSLKISDKLKPKEVIKFLDQYIIGQERAKKIAAITLSNRTRRRKINDANLKNEIFPKNILMYGPTGTGKTQLAIRLAQFISAPFLKVEATKFTEVGFHGRDVDSIVKDLVEIALRQQLRQLEKYLVPKSQRLGDARILKLLLGISSVEADPEMLDYVRLGYFDDQYISLPVSEYYESNVSNDSSCSSYTVPKNIEPFTNQLNMCSHSNSYSSASQRVKPSILTMPKKLMKIKDAREFMSKIEFHRLCANFSRNDMIKDAIELVEQDGIVFIDEIDKICSNKVNQPTGSDASSDGVQRDLLPLIEGTTVSTLYGNVKTDHILFIVSGAFHSVKLSDMMEELQGRLPVVIQLDPLVQNDFYRILTDTHHNLIYQNIAMLKTEDINLSFDQESLYEIAQIAAQLNAYNENLGARRLITVIEKVMEDINFDAAEMLPGSEIHVTADYVKKTTESLINMHDLYRFII